MAEHTIKFAQRADLPIIAYMWQAHINTGETPTHIDPAIMESWEERYEAACNALCHRHIFIAQTGRLVVGFVNFSFADSRGAYIEHLLVDELYRGEGRGTRLLAAVRAELPVSQKAISVELPDDQIETIGFFERQGFQTSMSHTRHARSDSIRLTKHLSAQH